jgi:hypothetical protein
MMLGKDTFVTKEVIFAQKYRIGVLQLGAEIIPLEPDPVSTGEGNSFQAYFSRFFPIGFNC